MPNLFPIATVLEFRRESADTSGRYAAMSDAALDLEALKRARVEVFADAQQEAINMQTAKERMDRHLARHEALRLQIEVAAILLGAASRG